MGKGAANSREINQMPAIMNFDTNLVGRALYVEEEKRWNQKGNLVLMSSTHH